MDRQYIVVGGNIIDGVTVYGTFDDGSVANDWAEDNLKGIDCFVTHIEPGVGIPYFDREERSIILELARTALADSTTFDKYAEQLDISDKVLTELREKIEKETNGVDIFEG